MTERTTKTITTPSGREVAIYTYLNARESNVLKRLYTSGMKIDMNNIGSDGKPTVSEVDGTIEIQAEEKLIELMVVSIDGSTESILDKILDGTTEDYDFILQEVNKSRSGNLNLAK